MKEAVILKSLLGRHVVSIKKRGITVPLPFEDMETAWAGAWVILNTQCQIVFPVWVTLDEKGQVVEHEQCI